MIYKSATKSYNCVKEVSRKEANDIYICDDMQSQLKHFYTLLVVHDHEKARQLIEMFETVGADGGTVYVESFSQKDDFCIIFDYQQERKLSEFYMGDIFSLQECETVCINLIMECITTRLPYPLLYLILSDRLLHLTKDKSVHFSYELDLTKLDATKKEKDCVIQCAMILMELLAPKKKFKATSYRLLEMKVPKQCYNSFTELYKDVNLAAATPKKTQLRKRAVSVLKRNQNRIFRFLLILCLTLGAIALIMILSQLILGDIPIYRLFINPFKTIGTESLLQ